ncbi:flagellar assembly protein FliX [Methylobacterium sp. 88A]|uniref:flagellar assembly protein FliX n=1 Tax=Methylobacterium sp. 88A TaxID=1131813 RepID=UPI00036882D5|nr:flagellar assembly protein FliX [Methylobacterium sp. 88A]
MRVDHRLVSHASASASPALRKTDASSSFLLGGDAAATTSSATTAPTTSLAGLDAILTLQGQGEQPGERRRRFAKRGHDLLDGLDRLKASLVMGRVSTRELQAIASRLSERAGSSGDPRLDGLIADIELRAAVELAKLSAAQAT